MQFGFKLTHDKALAGFFDRKAVTSAVDKAQQYVGRIAGYRVRQTARKSLKVKPYGKKDGTRNIGQAGRPPIAHDSEGLRRIYYSWDAVARATVVGPVLYRRKVAGKTIPEIHEFGATLSVNGDLKKYPRRPFMQPALEKHIPELPGLWKDALKRG